MAGDVWVRNVWFGNNVRNVRLLLSRISTITQLLCSAYLLFRLSLLSLAELRQLSEMRGEF